MSWRDSFSDNGAKQGRTETSPPTLRPIAPAGAKLSDWRKEIEVKINKLEAEIEGIRKACDGEILVHRTFRAAQESNFKELNRQISQIVGRFDKI